MRKVTLVLALLVLGSAMPLSADDSPEYGFCVVYDHANQVVYLSDVIESKSNDWEDVRVLSFKFSQPFRKYVFRNYGVSEKHVTGSCASRDTIAKAREEKEKFFSRAHETKVIDTYWKPGVQ